MIFRLDRIAGQVTEIDAGRAEPRAAPGAIRSAGGEVAELAQTAANCVGEELLQGRRDRDIRVRSAALPACASRRPPLHPRSAPVGDSPARRLRAGAGRLAPRLLTAPPHPV